MEYYHTLPIEDDVVIIESRNGRTIDGNNYYILKELVTNRSYEDLRIYLVAFDLDAETEIRKKIRSFPSDRIKIVRLESVEYYRIMASARYLINDSAFRNFYIKKDGQLYLNVWHGTPLKTMGKRVYHEPHAIGSVQKNFIIADYLLYPSEYMMEHMLEDYMIENLSRARIVLGGYPRNTAFFDDDERRRIRAEMSLEAKKVYAYMPTWRPDVMEDPLPAILKEMDSALEDDEMLYVNIHPLAAEGIDFEIFDSISPFPDEYESYMFLNVADALITDYSSVFFDFSVTGRKTVLFTYDEEDYFKTRGLYFPLSSLPFANVKTVSDVFDNLRGDEEPELDDFLSRFAPYERPEATADLCRLFFLGEDTLEVRDMPSNGSANILVHNGELDSQARRDALVSELTGLDTRSANYYLVFNRKDLKSCPEFLHDLPEGIFFYGRTGKTVLSPLQEDIQRQYKKGEIEFEEYWDAIKNTYALERRRYFGDAKIDQVIQLPPGPGISPEASKMELEMYSYL